MGPLNGKHLQKITSQFQIVAEFVEAHAWTKGHINDTYIVTCRQGGTLIRYIHQRINNHVFKDPLAVMNNVKEVTQHLRKKISQETTNDLTRRTMTLVPTRGGATHYKDSKGNFWRTYVFIERVTSFTHAEEPKHAEQVGSAFGLFQGRLSDLPAENLREVIPEFHNSVKRFEAFEQAVEDDTCNRAADAKDAISFVLENKLIVSILEDAKTAGKLPVRITHNDTKIDNILIDQTSGEAICIVDLDTVMPGIIHYDFGDMARTLTSPTAEDERDLSKVVMRMKFFEALAKGYCSSAAGFLTPEELEFLPVSGKVITFTLGIRFLVDHLEGDKYFRVHRQDQNLDRACAQFKLVQSMIEQEEQMCSCIAALS